ncbi:hypothetical protein E2C01_081223 [Portunus trituberculatus]|uniref:Uncharacterized protein n=1 Tax=Portunus trituberculatus TaxID=210409 RepID=A0A5B7J0I6_PORTR|nr:hypothetical protein [Portunus trituberculatus]
MCVERQEAARRDIATPDDPWHEVTAAAGGGRG